MKQVRIKTTVSLDDGLSSMPRQLSIERNFDADEMQRWTSPEWVASSIGDDVGRQITFAIREQFFGSK